AAVIGRGQYIICSGQLSEVVRSRGVPLVDVDRAAVAAGVIDLDQDITWGVGPLESSVRVQADVLLKEPEANRRASIRGQPVLADKHAQLVHTLCIGGDVGGPVSVDDVLTRRR